MYINKIIFVVIICLNGATEFAQSAPLSCMLNNCYPQIDSLPIENIHRYQKLTNLSLGNIGLPQYALLPDIDSVYKFRTLSFHDDTIGSTHHFDVKQPFTSVSYVLGSKSEQLFSVLHTQNISPTTNFSIEVQKVKSKGFYINQLTNNNYLQFNFWHDSKNENYKIQTNFKYQRIFNELNGGIEYDTLFEQDLLLNRNRQLMPVNLKHASTKIKFSQFFINQKVILFNHQDSCIKGSKLSTSLRITGLESDKRFKDSLLNLNYYSVILLDSTITNDKNYFRGVNGFANLQYEFTKNKNYLSFSPYFTQTIQHVLNENIDTILNYSSVGGKLKFAHNKTKVSFNYERWFNGFRATDFTINTSADFNLKEFKIKLTGVLKKYHPSIDLQSYKGNNIFWMNNFSPTYFSSVEGKITYLKTKTSLSSSYNTIDKAVVFNSFAQPQQSLGISQLIQTKLTQKFEYKKWNISITGAYQYKGGIQIFQLPDFIATTQVTYKNTAFKNNLAYLIGIEGVYFSRFSLENFSPMVYAYYLNQGKEFGNYPLINAFINVKIKSVRLFLKSTHLNAGLFGFRYYGAEHYPLKDRSFQFGLIWNFLN